MSYFSKLKKQYEEEKKKKQAYIDGMNKLKQASLKAEKSE